MMQNPEPSTTKQPSSFILTVNAGSSSIKFAVFTQNDSPERIITGQIERIGNPDAQLIAKRTGNATEDRQPIQADNHQSATESIAGYIRKQLGPGTIAAIGHRIVHGGVHLLEHQLITPDVLTELRRTQPLDMPHLPREIALIEAFAKSFPSRPQIACYDTAFHRDMPTMAKLLPIPRKFTNAGIRRFGFHGLSYTYLMDRLTTLDPQAAAGRVILAHLGNGASMSAVLGRKPIDTTMSFTPIAGLVMGTRPGDLDPGLLVYLMKEQKLSAEEMDDFISSRCGLLAISETSADMRDLLASRATDPRAADAVNLFCYQAKKHLCALASTLGGLDTLVFAGGIGEHAPEVRAAICQGLDFLGLQLDTSENARASDIISTNQSRVSVRIIPTDEEIVIVRIVRSILQRPPC
jgi:acetate kinase